MEACERANITLDTVIFNKRNANIVTKVSFVCCEVFDKQLFMCFVAYLRDKRMKASQVG